MLFRTVLLSFCCAILGAQPAPKLEGNWQGTLEAGIKLRLVVHITRTAASGYSATLDSIDQGAMGLPVDGVTLTGNAVRLQLARLGASFEGTIGAGGNRIDGQWKQGGASLPLVLERSTKALELKRPQDPAKPYPYSEEEVAYTNQAAGLKLAGTLTTPRAGRAFRCRRADFGLRPAGS